ncbi:hypothetical protein FGO68_gene7309 [Halteria grandinella]|uniref:Bromo domain-containing protein n=1 Tax=Halteria grandinella TaxID=5974 RepID=A0A8J8T536_HALGN|nr:hypothetical protein FGO68_gene7309 [Halteria grandinella]
MLSNLKKSTNAKHFQEPIDPKRDNAPNYFNIIAEPMDLGTVKQRLNSNYYHTMQEFLDDMQLIFENCLKYHSSVNGESDSSLVKASKALREDFKRLYEQLNIEFYIV